ncbi:MAG TPA: hypothetical protein VK470_01390, partial [Bacteroidota bacterium]|nr:hypothetical protein [Bacteroidota bacterium]
MKKLKLFAVILFIAGTGIFSCTQPNESTVGYTVNVSGTVTRKNFTPLDSVVVITEDPFRRDTLRNADGSFTISFTTTEKAAVTTRMTFSRPRFVDTTFTVTYSSTQKTIDLKRIAMRAVNPGEDAGGGTQVSQKPVSIVF